MAETEQSVEIPRKRLFFALWPDPAVRRALRSAQRFVVRQGRPVKADNLHLTLVFLGSVDPEGEARALLAADEVAGDPFQLVLDRYAGFRRARVQWLGCRETPRELTELQRGLTDALADHGFPVERRAYVPHLTLARKVSEPSSGEIQPIAWQVDHFCLVRSLTHAAGAEYRVLRRWWLPAAEPSG